MKAPILNDEPHVATYRCARCGQMHSIRTRPLRFPHIIPCQCGNDITVDDKVARELPEPRHND